MQNLPYSIKNDNDLNFYQEYLDNMQDDNANDNPINENTYQMQVENNNNMSFIPANNSFVPPELCNTSFIPAYLTKNIGKLMKVEFLIGNRLETRIGKLITVGASYIVLQLYQNSSTMMCDLYSIKFITIVHDNDIKKLPLY